MAARIGAMVESAAAASCRGEDACSARAFPYRIAAAMAVTGIPAPRPPLWRRLLPVLVIALAIGLVFAFRLDRYLSFDALAQHHAWLAERVEAAPILAPLAFVLIYAAAAALSLP